MGATKRPTSRKMHQTTVRFGDDLWEELEVEAKRLGVSVAQYVRDTALRRLSYEAGRRDQLAVSGGFAPDERTSGAVAAQERAASGMSESAALWAQDKNDRQHALEPRAQPEKTRAKVLHRKT